MKRKKFTIPLAAGISVLAALSIWISVILLQPTTEELTEFYIRAAEEFSHSDVSYNVSTTKTLHFGNNQIHTETSQDITYTNRETDTFTGTVTEHTQIGNYEINATESYCEGLGYFSVADCNFSGSVTKEAYIRRYAPVTMLDPTLYSTISSDRSGKNYILTLTEPAEIEKWYADPSKSLISASGSVTLSRSGVLLSCSYTVEYTAGNARITESITTTPSAVIKEFTAPNAADYLQIADPTLPKQLETVCGYLQSADNFYTEYSDRILCEAFGDTRQQTIRLNVSNTEQLKAEAFTNITLSNTGKIGADTVIDKAESFENGEYSISINGSAATKDANVDTYTMLTYCREISVSTVMLPAYIQDATSAQDGNEIIIFFTGNDAFTSQFYTETCNTLYQDADILKDQSQDEHIESATFYIRIETETGLPLASGFDYTAVFTSDALPYRLKYEANQTYGLNQ